MGVAPPASISAQPASPEAGPLATVNLGLSAQQARNVQCWPRDYWGYTGAIDGQAGPLTRAAFENFANGRSC